MKGISKIGFNRAVYAARKGSTKEINEYWATLISKGLVDKSTLKTLDKAGDEVAKMLRKTNRTLRKYGGSAIPDSVYKNIDEVADTMKRIVPDSNVLKPSAAKLAVKGAGKVAKGAVKATGKAVKTVVMLPIRIMVSPVTIPLYTGRAAIRALTGGSVKRSRGLIKSVVGKNASQIDEMELALRAGFKKKLAANPLLLASIIKTNGKQLSNLKQFKNLHPNCLASIGKAAGWGRGTARPRRRASTPRARPSPSRPSPRSSRSRSPR